MSDTRSYPRVLIAGGDPIGTATGTGVTLGQMFAGWPTECLAQVGFSKDRGVHLDRDGALFLIPASAVPLDYAVRRLTQKSKPDLFRGAPANPTVPLSQQGRRSWRARLHMEARALADISPLMWPRELGPWVQAFRPDVVYSLLGSVRFMALARALADHAQCPLVPHFMDDWIAGLYTDGQLAGLARRRANTLFAQVLKRSRGGLCISRPMAQEYARRYHLPFHDFMNCVEDSWFTTPSLHAGEAADGVLRITYCGGLHLGRDAVLRELGMAISEVSATGMRARLAIYAPESHVRMFGEGLRRLEGVEIGSRAPEEVHAELLKADVVVHVESFEPEHAQYTRYSVSTKIPQYLAAAKPVLAIGPAEVASMRHLEESRGAVLVTRLARSEIHAALERFVSAEERERLGRLGRAFAQERHAAAKVREGLRHVLSGLSRLGDQNAAGSEEAGALSRN